MNNVWFGPFLKARLIAMAAVVFLVLMATCVPCGAQATTDVYQLSAFDNNINPVNADQWVRIINPGVSGESVCADIYVFQEDQEMVECCNCSISANGLLTLSLKRDLTANSVTAIVPDRGVVKIVSSSTCDAGNPTPTRNLRAWIAHYETIVPAKVAGSTSLTDTRFDRSDLSAAELTYLGQACQFVRYLGAGRGICNCPATP